MKAAYIGSLLLTAAPLGAAERQITVSDFDRIRVDGGFVVDVATGRGASARIAGSPQAIETASVQVQGRTLIVRKNVSAWGGYPGRDPGPVSVRVSTPAISSAWVTGAATVRIDRMRAQRVSVSLEGSGRLTVASIEADRTDIGLSGSGAMMLGGRTGNLDAAIRGSGDLDTQALDASDVKLRSETAGVVTMTARRSASIVATGSGRVTVPGTAACTVVNNGTGTVRCGK